MNIKMNTLGHTLAKMPNIGAVFQKIATPPISQLINPSQDILLDNVCNIPKALKEVPQKPRIIFSSDYRQVDMYDSDGKHISETFSSAQALAISYMKQQHSNGTTKVHYKTILDHINTTAIRMSDVFKVTRKSKTSIHPLFGVLIQHDDNGYYWINLSL